MAEQARITARGQLHYAAVRKYIVSHASSLFLALSLSVCHSLLSFYYVIHSVLIYLPLSLSHTHSFTHTLSLYIYICIYISNSPFHTLSLRHSLSPPSECLFYRFRAESLQRGTALLHSSREASTDLAVQAVAQCGR